MNDLNDRFCLRPFKHFEIHNESSVTDKIRTYCCCPTWIKKSYGNIFDPNVDTQNLLIKKSFDEIWNSDSAIEFRKSVLDGTFSYCRIDRCPYIQNNTLPFKKDYNDFINEIITQDFKINKPKEINLCYDRSCNLACPSCRNNFTYVKKDSDEYKLKIKLNDFILNFIHTHDFEIQINCTGSGDPFASNIFQNFLSRIDSSKNNQISILLQTNGVLFTEENWEKIKNIVKLKNKTVLISLDAGTEFTYNKIRKGGDWKKLMENLDFISNLYQECLLDYVQLDFVVQQQNYKEIPIFIEICEKYGFGVYFSRIFNWKTWSDQEFDKHDVFNKNHNEHQQLLQIINNKYSYDKIFWGNVAAYKNNL